MKNQYFGDVYDYVKYGLLRRLSNYGESSTALCWMMTLDDERTDGSKYTEYLRDPLGWRDCDPEVWDFLCSQVLGKQKRSTGKSVTFVARASPFTCGPASRADQLSLAPPDKARTGHQGWVANLFVAPLPYPVVS